MARLLIFCIYMSPLSLRGPRATLKRSEAQRIFFLYVFHFSIRTLLACLYFVSMCPLLAYAGGHAPTLERSDPQNIFFGICSISGYAPFFFLNLTRIFKALYIFYLYVPFFTKRATEDFCCCCIFSFSVYASFFF